MFLIYIWISVLSGRVCSSGYLFFFISWSHDRQAKLIVLLHYYYAFHIETNPLTWLSMRYRQLLNRDCSIIRIVMCVPPSNRQQWPVEKKGRSPLRKPWFLLHLYGCQLSVWSVEGDRVWARRATLAAYDWIQQSPCPKRKLCPLPTPSGWTWITISKQRQSPAHKEKKRKLSGPTRVPHIPHRPKSCCLCEDLTNSKKTISRKRSKAK